MRYVGGKARLAKHVAQAIKERKGRRTRYVEPFVGGANVLAQVAPLFPDAIAGDIVPDLILFWEAIRDGWRPPLKLSKAEYEGLLNAPPSALRAWAAFAASYNGRWWGGYGPTAGTRDYLAESYRATIRKAKGIGHVSFLCAPYWEHEIDSNTVVYCDPPYQEVSNNNHAGLKTPETTGDKIYGSGAFDHDRFWATMQDWSDQGALVLVHEYTAPPGWFAARKDDRVETMNHRNTSSGKRLEVLWQREPLNRPGVLTFFGGPD